MEDEHEHTDVHDHKHSHGNYAVHVSSKAEESWSRKTMRPDGGGRPKPGRRSRLGQSAHRARLPPSCALEHSISRHRLETDPGPTR
jgi:hypothetical protein